MRHHIITYTLKGKVNFKKEYIIKGRDVVQQIQMDICIYEIIKSKIASKITLVDFQLHLVDKLDEHKIHVNKTH